MKNRITHTIFTATILTLAFAGWQFPGRSASAQTPLNSFEIVHFVETKGRITSPHAWDTSMYTHYAGTSTLTVTIYLYDDNTGAALPGPCALRGCTFVYGGSASRRRKIHFEDLVVFSPPNIVFLGFAIIDIRGDVPSTFITDTYLVRSHLDGSDVRYALLPLHPLPQGFRR